MEQAYHNLDETRERAACEQGADEAEARYFHEREAAYKGENLMDLDAMLKRAAEAKAR